MSDWVRSSTCGVDHCVEVKVDNGHVLVRRTVNHVTLLVSYPEWRTFLEGVKRGEFDLPERVSGLRDGHVSQ